MKRIYAVIFFAILGASLNVGAQSYPTRPLSLVVPFSPGGPTDTIARIMAERMGRSLGQTIVVENTTGAGGSIAVGKVARAAPDGYTLSIGHIGTHVFNGAIYPLQYDLLKDLQPVALIATQPTFLIANKAVPAKTMKELIAWMTLNKDKVSIGTGGAGTPAHISAIYFEQLTHTQAQIIHYRGAAPATQDLLAGHIDLYFDQAATAVQNIKANRVQAFAVTAKTRSAAAPQIPTMDEAGVPGLYMAAWHGLWVRAGTPKPIVDRLNAAAIEALADPAIRQRLEAMGQEIPSPDQQSPQALGTYQAAEMEKWWPVIKAAGVKVE
ncbi:MAG: tricarboxylate binding receptor [Herminiimonas sp.]|nr:tricarboxylate binding receptor [Herminiimonas sp.]MDB5853669.1 tricarboxylate binding receptor [Herminiimonas sp.]